MRSSVDRFQTENMFWVSVLSCFVFFPCALGAFEDGTRLKTIFLNGGQNWEVIASPGYPKSAPRNDVVNWVVMAPEGSTVLMQCNDIHIIKRLNCRLGALTVWDGSSDKNYCGYVKRLTVRSVGNVLGLRLTTGAIGFARVQCVVSAAEQPIATPHSPTPLASSPLSMDPLSVIASSFGAVNTVVDSASATLALVESFSTLTQAPASTLRSTSCPCGWVNRGTRIIGGTETRPNEYPFMVSIMTRSESRFCGGSIITPHHILTAAHCFTDRASTPLAVTVGEHDISTRTETDFAVVINVTSLIIHEGWDSDSFENDIALLVLETEIKYNRNVGPICLPPTEEQLVGQYVKAMGWGETRDAPATTLRQVDLRVIDLRSCSAHYSNTVNTRNVTQMCTFTQGRDTCQGDSGGPLIWLDPQTNLYTQVGLVSYGKDCADSSPAVNTEVFRYMNWIDSKVRETRPSEPLCIKI